MIESLGLQATIELRGFVPRADMLQALREAHLLLATHTTPESARILIEALICGTPIAIYTSAYPAELVREYGGAEFAPRHDWAALGDLLTALAADHERVAQLAAAAFRSGAKFTSDAVFAERSNHLKRHLSPHGSANE